MAVLFNLFLGVTVVQAEEVGSFSVTGVELDQNEVVNDTLINGDFEKNTLGWKQTGEEWTNQPTDAGDNGKQGAYYVNTGQKDMWHVVDGKMIYNNNEVKDNVGVYKNALSSKNITMEADVKLEEDTLFSLSFRGNSSATEEYLVIIVPKSKKLRFIQLPYKGEFKKITNLPVEADKEFKLKVNCYDVDDGVKIEAFIDQSKVLDYIEKTNILNGNHIGMFNCGGSGEIDNLIVYDYETKEEIFSDNFDTNTDENYYFPNNSSDGNLSVKGEMISEPFKINSDAITLLVGGGQQQEDVYVALVDKASGEELKKEYTNNVSMNKIYWDVSEYKEKACYIKIVDNSSAGYIMVDDIQQVDNITMSNFVSILESQVGYHNQDVKKVYLRSIYEKPFNNPTGKTFEVKTKDGEVVHTGKVEYWGEKWLTYWWALDFSDFKDDGQYYVQIKGEDVKSTVFNIGDDVLTNSEGVDLVAIAMDQLDERRKPNVPGWNDCGSQIRELSSHVVTVHALIDMYENKKLYDSLSEADKGRVIDNIIYGTDYIEYSQEHSEDLLYNGRFNHDAGRQTNYGTTDYHNWHGTAYAITALTRAHDLMKELNKDELAKKYLESSKLAFENAVYRQYNLDSDFAGRTDNNGNMLPDEKTGKIDDFKEDVFNLARVTYDKSNDWEIPESLKTKDKLTFLWGCTLLYNSTKEQAYLDMAIKYADSAAERQFTDWENPIEGVYGNFYAFENDDETFLLEWNQNHKFHMGNIEPTNVKGFINLLNILPQHEKAAKWYNVIKTYGDNYVKKTAEMSPFEIYPLTIYSDSVHGGVKYFQVLNHGAAGLYGQIAKNFMEIGDFLNDSYYQQLANQNIEFVAGLNPGIPNAYKETKWAAQSLIKGLGVESFPGHGSQTTPPLGSGMNGFSANGQFKPLPLSSTTDAPKGILKPNGKFWFNEDYLPHSHGYVSGVAKLENDFNLNVVSTYNGAPVQASVKVKLDRDYNFTTNDKGKLNINELPLQQKGRVEINYNGKTISKSIDTLGSGTVTWNVDFATYIETTVTVPSVVKVNEAYKGSISVKNLGDQNTAAKVVIFADGVTLSKASINIDVVAGETKTEAFDITAGSEVMPYLVYANVESQGNQIIAIAQGKVATP
jgi:hypothetical protein